jgi:hypothetical protein
MHNIRGDSAREQLPYNQSEVNPTYIETQAGKERPRVESSEELVSPGTHGLACTPSGKNDPWHRKNAYQGVGVTTAIACECCRTTWRRSGPRRIRWRQVCHDPPVVTVSAATRESELLAPNTLRMKQKRARAHADAHSVRYR